MTNKEASDILKNSGVIYSKGNYTPDDLEQAVELAIKALENEHKKGKWIVDDEDEIYMWCSQCEQGKRYSQSLYVKKTNFCPNCGADMREADNEQ